MKTEDVALARLRSDLLDTLWLKYPQALSLDQLEADVRVAYLTRDDQRGSPRPVPSVNSWPCSTTPGSSGPAPRGTC
jgi:hypothetical protein